MTLEIFEQAKALVKEIEKLRREIIDVEFWIADKRVLRVSGTTNDYITDEESKEFLTVLAVRKKEKKAALEKELADL